MFPNLTLSLRIEGSQFIESAKKALLHKKQVVLVTQKSNEIELKENDVYSVGVLCNISKIKNSSKNVFEIVVEGSSKVLVEDLKISKKSVTSRVTILVDVVPKETEVDRKKFIELKEKTIQIYKQMSVYDFEFKGIEMISDSSSLTNFIGMSDLFPLSDRQAILEELNVNDRVDKASKIIDQILNELSSVKKTEKSQFLRKKIEK